MMKFSAPSLTGKFVTLHSFQYPCDVDYLVQLAIKDEEFRIPESQIRLWIDLSAQEFWFVCVGPLCIGVVGYFKVGEQYILEALRDTSVKSSILYSVDAAKLILDYLFMKTEKIVTGARKVDKAVQLFCRKLKFTQTGISSTPYGDLIWFEKEKSCHLAR